MTDSTRAKTPVPTRVRLRPIALPAEHGGWSFLLEPILLGWLVAVSPAGIAYGVGMFFAFLTRQPLKLALTDLRRGQRLARTPYAERFAALYAAITLVSFALALASGGITPFVPLVIAAPLFALQAYWDAHNRSREPYAELSAPLALGVIAACITLAGGWTPVQAFALWALIAARSLPSILYVRARLRLERGREFSGTLVTAAHVTALLLMVVPFFAGLIPLTALVALVVLTARAVYGLSEQRKPSPPKVIGVQEVIFGVIFVALTALGYSR